MVDWTKSLTELEGKDWGPPSYPSYLVTTCHQLRHKALRELTPEELRIAIGQQMSLAILVPLALRQLRADPWVEGDYFEGDLLQSVLAVQAIFWKEQPDLWREANKIASAAWTTAERRSLSWRKAVQPGLLAAYATFQQRRPG
mgnify:CR=1 FL=1